MPEARHTPLVAENAEPRLCTLPRRLHVLAHTPFFSSLSSEEVQRISVAFYEMAFHAGQVIYVAGARAARLHIIATGKVKLMQTSAEGKNVVLDILAAGDFFGSLSSLGDERYPDTAVAHTDCCVLALTARDFHAILQQYPGVALAALQIVAARLRTMHEVVEQLNTRAIEQRIATTLLKLADKVGERKGRTLLIQMPLSRQDLAEMTGTTPETASRIMSQFRQAGLIRAGRRWVAILDPARLLESTKPVPSSTRAIAKK